MEKINVAELLKDCPSGMELDCTMYENLYFDSLNADYHGTINCYTLIDGIKTSINLTKYGTFNNHPGAKCVIFPKGKTTWEGFHRPFKDGDIVFVNDEYSDATFTYVAILKRIENNDSVFVHCFYNYDDDVFSTHEYLCDGYNTRFATEEEKQKLFQAIKDNGYKWNPETKTLEKLIEPKFKVGDRIRHKTHIRQGNVVTEIKDTHYILDDELALPFISQDDYELVPDKFDITTLKTFDKVLVRDSHRQIWTADFFSHNIKESFGGYRFACVGHCWHQCIPYEGNQHLLAKTDDCDEYFKTWK